MRYRVDDFFSFSVASRLRHRLKYKLVTSCNTAPTLSPEDFGLLREEWGGGKRLQCLMFNICYVFYNFRRVLLWWGRYKIIQSLCAIRTRPLLFWKQIQTVMTTSQVFVIYSSLFLVMQAFFQKYHNTLCCPFKILHKHCFQFLLGLTITPR